MTRRHRARAPVCPRRLTPVTDDASLPDAATLARVACAAARQAGAALAPAFRADQSTLGVTTKTNHHDLVTDLDRSTEDLLARLLTEAVPGSTVLGEERGTRDTGSTTGAPGIEWIIDPIDGTSNFVHGFAMFSISIAAVVQGTVRAGVVLDPVNQLEFSADDDGAYLNGAPLAPRPNPPVESRYNLVTSFPSAENLARSPERSLQLFGTLVEDYATVRRVVSGALELCFTAAGWADVTMALATHPWDIAAGQLVLRRAGGTVFARGGPDSSTHPEAQAALHLAPHLLGVAPGRETARSRELFEQIVAAVDPELTVLTTPPMEAR